MFLHFLHGSRTPTRMLTRGFGLIELMVSISLIVIVMGIVMVNHNSFNTAVLLRSQTYEAALQVRELQLNAVSVARSGDTFRAVYGVHFSSDTSNGANQRFALFRDSNGNYYFNSGEAFGIQGSLDTRFVVSEIRSVSGGTATPQDEISVVFERPNFDARFFTGPAPAGQVMADTVEIDIARSNNLSAISTIEITSAGQISITED